MPYEPPIEIISNMMNGLVSQIEEQRENQIVATIREQYHVECDREELIKALNYDRQQYEQGYDEGYNRGMLEWRGSTAVWFNRYPEYQCSNCMLHFVMQSKYCPHCGAKMLKEGEDNDNNEDG